MDLKQDVLSFIRRKSLVNPGEKLLIAVSGGLDSIVLTHLLYQMRHELSVTLSLAHFNHRLRLTALRDQRFVEQLANKLNLPIAVGARQVKLAKKVSEDQSRQWRYAFLSATAKKQGSDALVLAHHENDMAETVLMRLIRGTGLNGLKAMMPQRSINGINVIRPLLHVPKAQLERYAAKHHLKYCDDETNCQLDFLRNKIRHKLLPLLTKDYNPQIVSALSDLAATAADDYELLNQLVLTQIKENLVKFAQTVKIKQSFLDKAHPALRKLLLRHAFGLLNGDLNQLSYVHIQEAEDLIQRRPIGSVVHWPRSMTVRKKKGMIELKV